MFGRTIICQSLEIAGAYTRSHGLNSITLDGDKYDRKGSITGGYHDQKRSRLDAVKALKTWQTKVDELTKEKDEVKQTVAKLDQEVTVAMGKIQILTAKIESLGQERGLLVQNVMQAQAEEDRARGRIGKLEKQLEGLRSDVRNLEAEKKAYEDELKTKMEQRLSDEEIARVKELNEEIDRTRKELVEMGKATAEVRFCCLLSFSPIRSLMSFATGRESQGSPRD